MEKIHLEIMLSDVGESNFRRLVNVLHGKIAGRQSASQNDVDGIQEAWTSYVSREAHMLKLFSIRQH
jgi:hypothetical protein